MRKKRFWVSWWTSNYPASGVDSWPGTLKIWVSGSRGWMGPEQSLCAVIDAENETVVWQGLKSWFPDLEKRFCRETLTTDWSPPEDRFPGLDPARVTIQRKLSPEMSPDELAFELATLKLDLEEQVIRGTITKTQAIQEYTQAIRKVSPYGDTFGTIDFEDLD